MTKRIYVPQHSDIIIHGQSGTNQSFYTNNTEYCYGKTTNGIPYSVDITANISNAKKITLQTNDYFNKISSDHIIGFANETATLSAFPDEYHTFTNYSITGATLTSNQFKITQDTTAKANFSLKNGVTSFSASGDFGNVSLSGNNKVISSNAGYLWLSASANVPTSWSSTMWDPILTFPQNAAKNLMLKFSYDISAVRLNDTTIQNPWFDPYITNKFKSGSYYSGFDYINENDFYTLPINNILPLWPYSSHREATFYIENPLSAIRFVSRLLKFETGNNLSAKIYNTKWLATGIRIK